MDITAGILIYTLSITTTVCTNIDMEQDFPIHSYALWEKGLPENHVLYIVTRNQLLSDLALWKNKLVLCVGWLTDADTAGQEFSWISISDSISIPELTALVQNAFRHYFKWRLRLEQMIRSKESLNAILEDLENTYQLLSFVNSDSMQIIGVSNGFAKKHSWIDASGMVSFGLVNDLTSDEDFLSAAEHDPVFTYYFYENTNCLWYYCYNFKYNNRYCARLLVCTSKRVKMHGVMQITTILSECLASVYQEYYGDNMLSHVNQKFHTVISEMLHSTIVSDSELRSILGHQQWDLNHQYQLILFRLQQESANGIDISYYEHQIRILFRDCYVLMENSRFICIRNLTRSDLTDDLYKKNLTYFLRETLCKAGISGTFHSFHELYHRYLEANRALLIGERVNPSKWYYHFSDYILPYLTEQCIGELTPSQVCHPALAILESYDQKNSTQLLETLRIFLVRKHNITHTAAALEIHRTTLLARIERICILTGIDFDDYETCLHLMLSFKIRFLS